MEEPAVALDTACWSRISLGTSANAKSTRVGMSTPLAQTAPHAIGHTAHAAVGPRLVAAQSGGWPEPTGLDPEDGDAYLGWRPDYFLTGSPVAFGAGSAGLSVAAEGVTDARLTPVSGALCTIVSCAHLSLNPERKANAAKNSVSVPSPSGVAIGISSP